MVLESQDEYDSQWAALSSIAPKIGCTPEKLRTWLRQHERDSGGGDGGLTTTLSQHLLQLTIADAISAVPAYRPENDVSLKMPAFKYIHGERHW